jgi:RHS repeat-associated protein
MDDMPVAVVEGSTLRYIETDHLNTPRALIDPARNLPVWRWDLQVSAFGEHAANEDPDGDATLVKFNLRFPGQYLDAETGLHYNYFRDYEPGNGRYVQSDPIGLDGGVSTYAYGLSNPIRYSDPAGLVAGQAVGAGAAGWAAIRICRRIPACNRQLARLTKEAKELCDDVRCVVRYDQKPHNIPPFGHCQHWQIDCWLKSRPNSHFSIYVPNLYTCTKSRTWIDWEPFLP